MAVVAAFLGVVCLLNLLLLFALIRRVRGHDEQLASQSRLPPVPRLPVGSKAPDFTATTITGETRSLSDMVAGPRGLVAFLTPHCAPCRGYVRELQKYAAANPDSRSQVIVVICGPRAETAGMASELEESVSVVTEPMLGALQETFSVTSYPTFVVITKEGRIGARGPHLEAWNGYHLRLAIQ